MEIYMSYIVSIVCAVIAAISSILVSRKQTRGEIDKLVKQHELNLEAEKQKFQHELEMQELEHRHQLEIIQKESENKLGADMMNTFVTEAMKMPEIRQQISQGVQNSGKKKRT